MTMRRKHALPEMLTEAASRLEKLLPAIGQG
jgi:hypothetical protein